MSWAPGELWFDADLSWFGQRAPAFALTPPLPFPVPPGLAASRRRREVSKQRRNVRRARATALALSPAVILPFALRTHGSGGGTRLVLEDPPSLTLRLATAPIRTDARDRPLVVGRAPAHRELARQVYPKVEWHRATSVGLPFDGRLVDGTQLPIDGPDWVTWDPVTDSVPNHPHRLYGNEHTIRTIISVLAAYRAANPDAPRAVVGDISFDGGGPMDEHVSHQNGLDVDIYYPRLDRELSAPTENDQIDRSLSQDLVDRFVAAGAQLILVGYHTGLHGPYGVVGPYPNHENHMHVRFPPPG